MYFTDPLLGSLLRGKKNLALVFELQKLFKVSRCIIYCAEGPRLHLPAITTGWNLRVPYFGHNNFEIGCNI